MQPVALQSLSELERASLQELALFQLQQRLPVGHLSLDRDGPKGIKSIRQKLESFSKDRKDCSAHTFGVPLPQVIANDRACRQLQEAMGRSRRLCLEVEATVTRFRAQRHKRLGMGTSCIRAPDGGCPEEPFSPALVDKRSWSQRRGAMSVDSITDLSDNASELLEALQLSHPHELDPRRSQGKKKLLSLNPITWQVPRIVDRCCTHLETHGLQTVGIFRVGSSKKRVQQLREEFDQGLDVFLDEHQSVHDVAALLKEFFRDLPDSLIPRELYGAFLSTASLEGQAQLDTLQLLLFLLPPCHSDTLLRLLRFLAEVARHAESSWDPQGRQIPGNKMTVSNLATVFGPNILQKEKPGEKDAGALNFEDSAAIILVLQRLIEHHHSLFMVSPEMQWDVLRRLFQTDPDVIEYLLRRKFPDVPSPEREDPVDLSALPGWTHSLERGSVSSELYSNVSFLNLDVRALQHCPGQLCQGWTALSTKEFPLRANLTLPGTTSGRLSLVPRELSPTPVFHLLSAVCSGVFVRGCFGVFGGVTPGLPRSRAAVWGRSLPETPPSPGAGQKRRERSGRRRCRRDRSTGSRAAAMAEELSELLREFEEVMEDFDRGPASQYQQHLEELKRKAGQSVYDSGIDELESASTSPGSSLNSSEEHLNSPADTYTTKAKLGDTQELEEFIADLDKALEEM